MSPLSITLRNSDNFAVIHSNPKSWRLVLGVCTSMPGIFGEFSTGDLGVSETRGLRESGTRGLRVIRNMGLGVYQIHGT